MDILSLPDNEPFIAGTDESIDICSNQIMKLSDASICHCRRGKARGGPRCKRSPCRGCSR